MNGKSPPSDERGSEKVVFCALTEAGPITKSSSTSSAVATAAGEELHQPPLRLHRTPPQQQQQSTFDGKPLANQERNVVSVVTLVDQPRPAPFNNQTGPGRRFQRSPESPHKTLDLVEREQSTFGSPGYRPTRSRPIINTNTRPENESDVIMKNERRDCLTPTSQFQKVKHQLQQTSNASTSRSTRTGDPCACWPTCEKTSKELIKELYQENESLRIRVKGIEIISDISNQTRLKNITLEKNIADLTSRLQQLGHSDLDKDETRNDRMIEVNNAVFLKNLKTANEDALQSNASSEKDVAKQLADLRNELCSKNLKISELEDLVRSPDDAKTAKIQHLQDVHAMSVKDLRQMEYMCQTLTSEVEYLRHERDVWKARDERNEKMASPNETVTSVADQLKASQSQVERLTREKAKMAKELSDVISMNTRWQHFNDQRETHIVAMARTSKKERARLAVLERERGDMEDTINGLNALLDKQRRDAQNKSDTAVFSLEQQLVQKDDRILELVDKVSELRTFIKDYESERDVGQRREDKEMIETLRQQVKIFRDDFDQERKDRERIQGNNEILRHRLQDALQKLVAHEHRAKQPSPVFRMTSPNPYDQSRRVTARGISQLAMVEDEPYLPYDVEIDGRDQTDGLVIESLGSDTEPLECPRCARAFQVANHSDFMRHVGVCLDQ